MKKAFTLAEVLITLGIIGIVAAMTLPALIGKYQKNQTLTQLKKAYTEISQPSPLVVIYKINKYRCWYKTGLVRWEIKDEYPLENIIFSLISNKNFMSMLQLVHKTPNLERKI